MSANQVRWTAPRYLTMRAQNGQRPGRSAMGRSTIIVDCPFCRAEIEAYSWSMAGSGKRCTCGALHGYMGESIRWKTNEEMAELTGESIKADLGAES